MAATIKIKNSSTASAVPTSSDLVQGELAVNVTDKRIFTENASGTVVELGTNPTILTLPDGSASSPTLTNDGDTNTGIFFPAADTVGISTGGSERARVDSSGNLGLGVTPSAWNTAGSGRAIQMKNSDSKSSAVATWYSAIGLLNDCYFGTDNNFKYYSGGAVGGYEISGGAHSWNIASSGTAGNTITFTQAMTLDASGNLMVGTTSSSGKITTVGAGGTTSLYGTNGSIAAFFNGGDGSTVSLLGTVGAYPLGFYTNGAERARIDSSGNLALGTASPVANTRATIYADSGTAMFVQIYQVAPTLVQFANSQGNGGAITMASGGATSYGTSSDYRLKENIQPLTGALSRVAQLKPVVFNWKVDGSDGESFIAHELAEVCPQAVHGEKDAVDEDGNPKYQNIDTSHLVSLLTAAIQELKATVDAQAARITALEQA